MTWGHPKSGGAKAVVLSGDLLSLGTAQLRALDGDGAAPKVASKTEGGGTVGVVLPPSKRRSGNRRKRKKLATAQELRSGPGEGTQRVIAPGGGPVAQPIGQQESHPKGQPKGPPKGEGKKGDGKGKGKGQGKGKAKGRGDGRPPSLAQRLWGKGRPPKGKGRGGPPRRLSWAQPVAH